MCLEMVIKRWKNSKTLQVSVIQWLKVLGKLLGGIVRIKIYWNNEKEIISYQQHMDRVDCEDQHRLTEEGFTNVSHFKNCYKKSL